MTTADWFLLASAAAILFVAAQMIRLGRRTCFGGAPPGAVPAAMLGFVVACTCLVASAVVGAL